MQSCVQAEVACHSVFTGLKKQKFREMRDHQTLQCSADAKDRGAITTPRVWWFNHSSQNIHRLGWRLVMYRYAWWLNLWNRVGMGWYRGMVTHKSRKKNLEPAAGENGMNGFWWFLALIQAMFDLKGSIAKNKLEIVSWDIRIRTPAVTETYLCWLLSCAADAKSLGKKATIQPTLMRRMPCPGLREVSG